MGICYFCRAAITELRAGDSLRRIAAFVVQKIRDAILPASV
jgi:hypothetical protein